MLNRILLLDNPVQTYAWGSLTAIPELLGRPGAAAAPEAELWMGAHPKAPSHVRIDGKIISLADIIQNSPRAVLGAVVSRKFGRQLPFLFKVLAAAKPLSIQAHPADEQAREGFARENRLGIALDAPNRNYRDAHPKPECLCALTDFWGLSGFRRINAMLGLLTKVWPDRSASILNAFQHQPDPNGLKAFFATLMGLAPDIQGDLVESGIEKARRIQGQDPAFAWMEALYREYPGDMGVFAPLLLNLIHLQPGEAVFLAAGQLHAYLQGVGIELMANSDNVLRGGLTPKHVDVEELLNVVRFDPLDVKTIAPVAIRPGEKAYSTPADAFGLSVITVAAQPESDYLSPIGRSVEILLCTRGNAWIYDVGHGEKLHMPKGCSVLVPAAVERYRIEGDATLYKAFVPQVSCEFGS